MSDAPTGPDAPGPAWIWAGAQRAECKEVYDACTPAPARLSVERLCAAFGPVANDSLTTVIIWGYAEGALELIGQDTWLARKTYIWALRPVEARALVRDLEAGSWRPSPPVRVHLCADHSDLIEVFSTFGLHHGLVVLDEAEATDGEIQRQRVRLGNRSFHGFERSLHDFHLLAQRLKDPVEAVPLARLKGLHQGRAALCVAAGPSLDRRLDFLRRHQAHCVVIAADLIAHKLEEAGVRVDFVVSVDTGEAIVKRCHASRNPDMIAVLPLAADRRLDAIFPKRSYVWVEPTNTVILDPATSNIPSGTNVGAAVVGLSIHLGCSESVLVGHDLSFTLERLYSSCVDDRKDLEDASLRMFRVRMQEVPGNGGKKVSTNTQFAMAAEDMASMILLHPKVGIYNINISDASGALIRGAKELPAAWTPPAIPAPAVPAAEILPWRISRSLHEEFDAQVAEFQGLIFKGLDAGKNLLAACADAWAQAERLPWASHFAEPMLGGMEPFCLNELTRPMHEVQPDLIADAARVVRDYLPRWFALCRRALDEDVKRPPELNNKAKDTLVELFCSAPPPVRSSLQEILLPLYLSVWADLAEWFPEADPPLPAGLAEAVTVVSRFGTQAPQATLLRILAMCAVDGSNASQHILQQARKDGAIPEGRLLAASAADDHPGPMGAAEAVLALREALPGLDPAKALTRIGAQPFARLPGIEAALRLAARDRRAAQAVLEAIEDGRMPVDDAIAATCIELHPDTVAVLTVLGSKQFPTGERTRLAVGRRFLAIGDATAALAELADVRPLSVFGVEARALSCLCLQRLGRPELVAEVLGGLPAASIAARVLYRYAVLQRQTPEQVIRLLDASGIARMPADVLAACLDDALEAEMPQSAVLDLRRMVERSQAAALPGEQETFKHLLGALEAWEKLRSPDAAAAR